MTGPTKSRDELISSFVSSYPSLQVLYYISNLLSQASSFLLCYMKSSWTPPYSHTGTLCDQELFVQFAGRGECASCASVPSLMFTHQLRLGCAFGVPQCQDLRLTIFFTVHGHGGSCNGAGSSASASSSCIPASSTPPPTNSTASGSNIPVTKEKNDGNIYFECTNCQKKASSWASTVSCTVS